MKKKIQISTQVRRPTDLRHMRLGLALLTVLVTSSLWRCSSSPTGPNPDVYTQTTSGSAGPAGIGWPKSISSSIRTFTNESEFLSVLAPDSVKTVFQDPSRSGTTMDGSTYELVLDEIRIQIQGPGFYGDPPTSDTLSKGVPVRILFPSSTRGAGLAIDQRSRVSIIVTSSTGEALELSDFSNGGLGFLGFTSPSGIATIDITDPNPTDSATPITNLKEITYAKTALVSEPASCNELGSRRPTVRVEVDGSFVRVTAKAFGMGIPGELDFQQSLDGSFGRFALWPHGRHNGPKIVSALFPTSDGDDFPIEVQITYNHGVITSPQHIEANLDYEILAAAINDMTDELEVGVVDENELFYPMEIVVLQCDRGIYYDVRP